MNILLIAPPGAGKGTQGTVIAEELGLPHIATGDLLRDNIARGTELGRASQALVERGELVPDDLVLEMVREVLERDGRDGYVLDGVPRTIEQARTLYQTAVELGLTADVALHLHVPDDVVVERLLARAAEQGRADDTADVIRHRLALYHRVTAPILAWYQQRDILVTVDAAPPVEEVTREVLAALESVRLDDAPPADTTGLAAAFGVPPEPSQP